jgi:hypothetical protein
LYIYPKTLKIYKNSLTKFKTEEFYYYLFKQNNLEPGIQLKQIWIAENSNFYKISNYTIQTLSQALT